MRAPLWLLIPLLATSLLGCQRGGQPETLTPTPAQPAASAPTTDANFGCRVDADALAQWPATGMELAPETRERFRLWTEMGSSEVPAELEAQCTNPPPSGDYSPVKAPEQGGVVRGDVVVAVAEVEVYRAYSSGAFECSIASPAQELGSWWALAEPGGDKARYAADNAICPAWNELSMVVSCTLAPGTVVVVGPTQSASCTGTSTCDPAPADWPASMPATAAPQLFINTYAEGSKRSDAELEAFLRDCEVRGWE